LSSSLFSLGIIISIFLLPAHTCTLKLQGPIIPRKVVISSGRGSTHRDVLFIGCLVAQPRHDIIISKQLC